MPRATLISLVVVLGLVGVAVRAQKPDTGSISAKVETLALAPSEKGVEFFISPKGGHVAAIVQKGSRFVVAYDGIEGPRFDEILNAGHQIHFSPDNARYLYVGRLGQEYVVMVDGKELARLPVATSRWNRTGLGNLMPFFSANSKHTFFVIQTGPENHSADRDLLFFDGQVVPMSPSKAKGLSLSPDGEHYAYIVANPVNEQQWSLIVDGKPAGYKGGDPRFTADGKHLITRVEQLGVPGVEMLLDGKPWFRAPGVRLYVPPVGSGVVAVVTRPTPTFEEFLVVNGKRVESSLSHQIAEVYFSPDGKHYAAECSNSSNFRFMVVDGKKGQEYQFLLPVPGGTTKFVFSADSSRSVYTAQSGGKNFVVVDGQESDGYPSLNQVVFSPDGKRLGFTASGTGMLNVNGLSVLQRWVVIDSKAVRKDIQVLGNLAFSPDGSRYAYIAGSNAAPHLVVDGVEDAGSTCCMFNQAPLSPKFVFSPEGKHVVHFGASQTNARRFGFFFNGKFIPSQSTSTGIYNPTFTPDGRHFFWLQMVMGPDLQPRGYAIYANGRPAFQLDVRQDNVDLLTKVPGAWETGTDGVLTAIAHVGESIQRIRITPSADTSVDTFIASAGR